MTIFTKTLGDKGKLVPVLTETNELEKGLAVPGHTVHDGETGDRTLLFNARPKRLSSVSTIFILLPALCVIFLGIFGGAAIYRAYARNQSQLRFHGYCGLPYENNESIDDNNLLIMINNKFRKMNDEPSSFQDEFMKPSMLTSDFNDLFNDTNMDEVNNIFFKQEVDLDMSEDQGFTKIDVPNFRDGREGRFMHDFKHNESAIIDNSAKRCFVMPLDRDVVMPPRNFYDVIRYIWAGYYNIDTNVIRKNMRVVLPKLTDEEKENISQRIQSECQDSDIYRLEKYFSGVFKRSADIGSEGKFAEFAGHAIVEYNIMDVHRVAN